MAERDAFFAALSVLGAQSVVMSFLFVWWRRRRHALSDSGLADRSERLADLEARLYRTLLETEAWMKTHRSVPPIAQTTLDPAMAERARVTLAMHQSMERRIRLINDLFIVFVVLPAFALLIWVAGH